MLNNILKLNHTHVLDKKQQLTIQGGEKKCFYNGQCQEYGAHCKELQCSFDLGSRL